MSTHGHWARGERSPTYICWMNMKARCLNAQNPRYKDYGERGITVCAKWLTFEGFLEDMKDKPCNVDVISIERIDNNKGYYKENCYWATAAEQGKNKRDYKNNTTGYRNISMHHGRFRVEFRRNGKLILKGDYLKVEDALTAKERFLQAEKNGA